MVISLPYAARGFLTADGTTWTIAFFALVAGIAVAVVDYTINNRIL